MKVLVAGSRGYCGRGVVQALRRHGWPVVGFDVLPLETLPADPEHVEFSGDIGDVDFLARAVAGCQGVINATVYRPSDPRLRAALAPGSPLETADILQQRISVTGTFNLLEVAWQSGVRQAVLLSSGRVVWDHFVRRDQSAVAPGWQATAETPLNYSDAYGLSKHLQELVGRHFAAVHGMAVTIFRPWWVVDGGLDRNRMDEPLAADTVPLSPAGMVDYRDLGEACYLALLHQRPGAEIYYPVAGPGCDDHFDAARLRRDLGWRPVYTFDHLAPPNLPRPMCSDGGLV